MLGQDALLKPHWPDSNVELVARSMTAEAKAQHVALALAAETALAAPAAALACQLLAAKLHSQTWKA